MIGVVDTSALIRLFIPDGPIPDGLQTFFRGVERGIDHAIAPELLTAEAANVVWKKVARGDLSGEEGASLLADVLSVPIRLFRHHFLIEQAFDLSLSNQPTVYDNLFLALALQQGAVVFSADRDLMKAADAMKLTFVSGKS